MKKNLRNTICTLLIISLSMLSFTITTSAETDTYETLINSDISETNILVVLKNEVSLQFQDYSTSDFPEIDCTSVSDLTPAIGTKVMKTLKSMENKLTTTVTNSSLGIYSDSSIGIFNQVLNIELKNPSKEAVIDAIIALNDNENVLCASPDYKISQFSTYPNDNWSEDQWAIEMLDLPQAWDKTTGSASIVVGIIDSGIDGTHEDLRNRINTNLCRDYSSGGQLVVSSPTDLTGHGTKVAGIVGAQGNNTIGVCGVCWNVRLASLRVFDSSGSGYSSYVIKAINFATQTGIDILNFSGGWETWESDFNQKYAQPLETTISNFPGLFVCAAGNAGKDIDSNKVYPASYTLPNLITVGACTKDDTINSVSNVGYSTVDLFAPGDEIYTCLSSQVYSSRYGTGDNTSMAAPFVSGAAALLLAKYPTKTAVQIKQEILAAVETSSEYTGKCVSGGRLNIYNMLANAPSHYHNYTANYISMSAAYHKAYCSCGDYVTQAHSFSASGTNQVCTKCGHSIAIMKDEPEIEIQ